jgi:hypothetical protein
MAEENRYLAPCLMSTTEKWKHGINMSTIK